MLIQRCALAGAVVLIAASSPGVAQDGGGLTATATVRPELRYDDDEGTRPTVTMGFGLSSRTRSSRLSFDGSFRAEASDGSAGLEDPSMRLAYGTETRSTALEFAFDFRETDVDSLSFVPNEDFTNRDLIVDQGTRRDSSLSFGLDLGRGGPVEVGLDLGLRRTRFADTTSPGLVDTDRAEAGVEMRFRLNPATDLVAGLGWQELDTFGQGTDRTTTDLRLGVDVDRRDGSDISAALHFDRVRLEDAGGRRVNEGLGVSVSAGRDLRDGRVSVNLSSRVAENGRRSTLRFGREMTFKNGALGLSIGVRDNEGADPGMLYGLDYNTALSDLTTFGASFDQSLDSDLDAREILRSTAQLSVTHTLSDTQSLNAGVSFFDVDTLGLEDDSRRVSVNLGYRQSLSRDWTLNTTLFWQDTQRDTAADETNTTLAIGVSRAFNWRP